MILFLQRDACIHGELVHRWKSSCNLELRLGRRMECGQMTLLEQKQS